MFYKVCNENLLFILEISVLLKMKRTQSSDIRSFFKRQNVHSPSNTMNDVSISRVQEEDNSINILPISENQDASVIELDQEVNFSATTSESSGRNSENAVESFVESKYDIGCYINMETVSKLTTDEKLRILNELWVPSSKYCFPAEADGPYERKFQLKWLDSYKWLCYSKKFDGSFCRYCVFFRDTANFRYGMFVLQPCKKVKKSLELFKLHEKTNYHKNAIMTADSLLQIANKTRVSIIDQLDSKRAACINDNKEKLRPIIQTIRLCGRQMIPLRGHQDSGRLCLEEPINNDGNFRALLRYRIQGGDNILKQHVLS